MIILTLAYDGSNYLGWQDNDNGPTIQGTVRRVLEKILQHPIILDGASRTDAGVHAEGQLAWFDTDKDSSKLQFALNRLLPLDIRVLNLQEGNIPVVACKTYRYKICFGHLQLPSKRHHSWHVYYEVDIELMKQAAKILSGTHNFKAFCNMRQDLRYDSYMRTVDIDVGETGETITVSGKSFLYKMVRNIVGTIIDAGRGKLSLDDVREALVHGDRERIGITAPAHGLTLVVCDL